MVRENQLEIIKLSKKVQIFVNFTVDTSFIDCLISLGNTLITWLGHTTWIISTLKYHHSSWFKWRQVISHLTNVSSPCPSNLHVSLPWDVLLVSYKVRCRHNVVHSTHNSHKIHTTARQLCWNPDLYSAVTVVMFVISWYMGPRYNGIRLHIHTNKYVYNMLYQRISVWLNDTITLGIFGWSYRATTLCSHYQPAPLSIISEDGEEIVHVPRGPCLCTGS